MKVLDLFSGIGGFSLGLERAGMETVAFCEIEPFCQKVLKKHWAHIPIYNDVTKLTKEVLENDGINAIDLICGGYPCQPFSTAGKQKGQEDKRHLYPEMSRLIREIKPRWVIAENVEGHIRLGLDAVLDDLEAAGYTVWAFIIPAQAVGAPHQRNRVWIIATDSTTIGLRNKKNEQVLESKGRDKLHTIQSRDLGETEFGFPEFEWCRNLKDIRDLRDRKDVPEPLICRNDDGFSQRVDRLKALGNSVVPQIPEIIGKAIMKTTRNYDTTSTS